MIITLGVLFVFLICYEIFILKRFDLKRVDTDELLSNYNSKLINIIDEVIKDIDYTNIHSEEGLVCYLISEIYNQFECLLLEEKLNEDEYEALTREVVEDYINSKLLEVDTDSLWQKRMYQYINTSKEEKNNTELASERVPNSTKSDESTVDILSEVNSIFFE